MKGFNEEVFMSFLRCGHLATKLNHPEDEIVNWFSQAITILPERTEP